MAKNPNNSLLNKHAFYVGMTGSGKTNTLRTNKDLKKAKRVLYWDPLEDHGGSIKCESRADFLKALRAAGKTYKIALTLDNTAANFEFFCQWIWTMADGKKPIVVVNEEMGDACNTSGALKGKAGMLYRGGRKYGLIILSTNQRIADIPKTIVSQSQFKYVHKQDLDIDVKRAAEMVAVRIEDIRALKELECYYRIPGVAAKLIKTPYRK